MNGKETRVHYTSGLGFAKAGVDFDWDKCQTVAKSAENRKYFSEAHKNATVPELALKMYLTAGSERKLVEPLKDAGYTVKNVNNGDKFVLIDASNVEWFAYDAPRH